MANEILVSIVRNSQIVEQVRRPLRWLNGHPAITYHKKLWPVHEGVVYLDGSTPVPAIDRNVEPAEQKAYLPPANIVDSPTLESSSGWDSSQQNVISASRSAKLIVDAGPGTGKTAVACARLAHLIEKGLVEAVNCLVVSFTQTAVHEVRTRIKSYLSDPIQAASIKIITLDAYAWSIRSGFDSSATISGSYEEGVAAAIQLIAKDPDAAECLERAEHVIIDEAQDIIGARAEFIIELINKLTPECGVTAFADEAQAIYGFAEDNLPLTHGSPEPPLPQRLRNLSNFQSESLSQVHRTSSPELLEIFTTVRGMVLSPSIESSQRSTEVRTAIERLTGHTNLQARSLDIATLPPTALILFRRRAEALMASAHLKGAPHRLRLGGMPSCIPPWVAVCFFDIVSPRLGKDDFEKRWQERVAETLPGSGHMDSAWEKLTGIAGAPGQTIDIRTLRQKLGRRQTPPILCSQEFGTEGPILGTIHGSKGREAETVILLLPPSVDSRFNEDEETRIMFVGATRAREQLQTGSGFKIKTANLQKSKRAYSFLPRCDSEIALMTEIGRDGDIWPAGLTGREYFDEASAIWAQQRCLKLATAPAVASAHRSQATKNLYAVTIEDEQPIAILSPAVKRDLWSLAEIVKPNESLYPSSRINHLRLIGIRSIVLPPDAAEVSTLHEPWASSGFMLAPMLLAYTKIKFRKKI